MEPDISVMTVWPMAAMEAQASGWAEIEPAHLLCATLKFAELGADELQRVGEAVGNADELRKRRQDLLECLNEPWGIAVPDVSTTLRRALRREGSGEPNQFFTGMLHRSTAARDVFRAAQAIAAKESRRQFSLVDLAIAILRDPDEWVRRTLDQYRILSSSQVAVRDQGFEKWRDVLVPLATSNMADDAERQRILVDPVVRVLRDLLSSSPGPLPCLLISGPGRNAYDVLLDVLKRPGERKLPRITRIDSRALLAHLAEDASLPAAFLDFLTDEANCQTVWFVDSFHRYLTDDLAPDTFRMRFLHWLKQTNGRFVFAIPESHYKKQAREHPEWKDVFQPIWVCGPAKASLMEL
jgi:hypothetical protein